MKKNNEPQLSNLQKEAIAEQLAEFFFNFWERRKYNDHLKIKSRNGKAIALDRDTLESSTRLLRQ